MNKRDQERAQSRNSPADAKVFLQPDETRRAENLLGENAGIVISVHLPRPGDASILAVASCRPQSSLAIFEELPRLSVQDRALALQKRPVPHLECDQRKDFLGVATASFVAGQQLPNREGSEIAPVGGFSVKQNLMRPAR